MMRLVDQEELEPARDVHGSERRVDARAPPLLRRERVGPRDEAEDPAWERWRSLAAPQVWVALEERRAALVSAVSALAPAQLARTGVHQKFGAMSVPRWLEFFLVHEAHHLYVALQRLAEARSARR